MSKSFPLVPLKEVLHLSIDAIPVEPSETYPIAGVYSFGRGLLARSPILGTETTYKVFHRLHKHDFVLSQLKAWEGALALVTESFDGWFLSTQFPTFRAIPNRLEITYLDWYCKQSKVWEQLKSKAQGMGARRDSVSPKKFLSIEIPLPPLEEQRRIVARVEELAGKIEEARSLRQKALKETEALRMSSAKAIFTELAKTNTQPLRDLVTVQGGGTPSKRNPLFWEGSIPWVSPKDMKSRDIYDSIDHISEEAILKTSAKLLEPNSVLIVVRGMILAHTVPSAVLRVPAAINQDMKALIPSEQITPKYLSSVLWGLNYLLLELIEKSSHDTRKLETPKLLNFKIPVPPLPEQHRIVAYLDNLQAKVDEMKRLREQAIRELDAMLPSILDKAFKGEL